MGLLDDETKKDKTSAIEVLEPVLSVAIPILAAAVGAFLGWHITEQKIHELDGRDISVFSEFVRYSLTVSFALVFAFFGAVSVEYFKVLRRRKRDMATFLNNIDNAIENRMSKVVEHTAFFTESGRLEGIIQLLKNMPGKKKWIVAKFISRQLSDSFLANFRIEIDTHSYSGFAESLYQECEEAIFLTSPFTPEEWFRQLIPDEKVQRIQRGVRDASKEYETPAHVRALSASPAVVKRRLVILPNDKWLQMEDSTKVNLLKEFLKVNKEVDTRFITQEDLQDKLGVDYAGTFDYAIFDRRLFLQWERPANGRDTKPLCMYTDVPDSHRRLVDLFDYKRHGAFYKTGAELLNDIKSRPNGT